MDFYYLIKIKFINKIFSNNLKNIINYRIEIIIYIKRNNINNKKGRVIVNKFNY